jgi:phenylalanyl-tRNA synthetase alpha chain
MNDQITQLLAAVEAFAFEGASSVEEFKRLYTGRKGQIPALFDQLKTLSPDEKSRVGKPLNELKQRAQARQAEAEAELFHTQAPAEQPPDPTLPGQPYPLGGLHPLRIVQRRVLDIFSRMGFEVALGPEIEDDWHCFTGLNFPPGHPARDMQDTFFVGEPGSEANWLLRTHTTSVQLRELERRPPPVRIVMPGRVYRNEAISARAHCYFHQIDGFAVDKGLSFADMKQTLLHFVRQLFGDEVEIRLRASYFPFTEISVEMDISCRVCLGAGCAVCKHSGWVEILGAGMVDPNVLTNAALGAPKGHEWDPTEYTGYAWGMGLERVAQLLFRVPDLRLYAQNDVRFLSQFHRIQA